MSSELFAQLDTVCARPQPFQYYTAMELWTDEHTSEQMLAFHLNEKVDVSSRNMEFIDKSVDWIVSQFGVGEETRIIDFGCGPGLYTTKLAQEKAKVVGIDFSKRSIEYAEEKANERKLIVQYLNQNYLGYETTERFDLILMIMCDYCALNPEQRKKILGKFVDILEPGGAVLLDVYSSFAYGRREEHTSFDVNLMDGFWSPNRYYGFLNTFKYDEEQVVLDKYTVVEHAQTKTVYNWLQYYDPKSLERELAANGLKIEKLYGDVAGSPFMPDAEEFAIVARKINQ